LLRLIINFHIGIFLKEFFRGHLQSILHPHNIIRGKQNADIAATLCETLDPLMAIEPKSGLQTQFCRFHIFHTW
jgi:hypothetical protein